METLFNMDETSQKKRPTKITERQKKQMYADIAQEIVNNGWGDDIEEIVSDLKKISLCCNGYQLAKRLDEECGWSIEVEMIDFLDGLGWRERDIKEKNIEEWVKCTKPILKYPIGTKLKVISKLTRSYDVDMVVYVNVIYDKSAQYGISLTNDSKTNTMIDFEVFELNTVVID